ncbi:signal peptidase I [Marilutibacter maris]|uniref:Signal peptidase I n=1 Tax=Marilutibacter maris TaxID=1605891 RepID=A0A2U9T775_9GAMM|nr:signal peptidase I [Lysobacter maris]AWV06814.1 putative signal peptidase [Lysobacter maris]
MSEGRTEAWRRWLVRGLLSLAVLLPAAAIGMYLLNPLGANSIDPRQRILGHAPYRMSSMGMSPTLESGQIVIVRAGAYRARGPERGDVVLFAHPEYGEHWLQRVIGLPGETVSIEDCVLMIDGRALGEDYVAPGRAVEDYSCRMAPLPVPQGQYLLMGDNRDNSMDGRMMGPIAEDTLVGRVVRVLHAE